MAKRAWMMRTTRMSEAYRNLIFTSLKEHKTLRQGWAWQDNQNLRILQQKRQRGESFDDAEQAAWRNNTMLGEEAGRGDDAMLEGDLILLPNVPQNGTFSICRILKGGYQFEEDSPHPDFRHLLPAELVGFPIANSNKAISAHLRSKLKARGRIIRLHELAEEIAKLSKMTERDANTVSSSVDRVMTIAQERLKSNADVFAEELTSIFNSYLQAAEWEVVIREGISPLVSDVEVRHTGGASERGADLEIRFPNPFEPNRSWVVVVQVKDFTGEIGSDYADQLEWAFTSRKNDGDVVIEALLVTTNARPSKELKERLEALRIKHNIEFRVIEGPALMRGLSKGFLKTLDLFDEAD